MAHLEIFETSGSKRMLRPASLREGKGREAVQGWADELGEADCAPVQVTFKRKLHGHELFIVRVGSRRFDVITH
jgi:hypothetical protein